ncbi:MAG: type II toxin-antitoxin system death-on-curing family toxin [Planctomycetes bacterium]|nr:type II toxin-antitoxin system death-on-curing family toxin [Planctomycetota bacterium]
MNELQPVWIDVVTATSVHERVVEAFGGEFGIRDPGLLESALEPPKNLWAYERRRASVPRMAAAIAFGIARNHPFVDGNRRTAFVLSMLFLERHGLELAASQQEKYETFMALAEGRRSEEELGAWFEARTRVRSA